MLLKWCIYRGSQAQREDISITPYSEDSSSGEASCSGSSTNEIDPYDPALYEGRRLSEDEKLLLLTNTWKPPCTFKFPVTSGRRFNPAWLIGRPWLRYSITNDSLFCISCMLIRIPIRV